MGTASIVVGKPVTGIEAAGKGDIIAGVGEGRIAQSPAAALATYALGSCIAVVAYDWKLKLGGIAHVMLPDSAIDPGRAAMNPWAYADTSIPTLVRELTAYGSSRTMLRWHLAGGAEMMADSAHFATGKKNLMALRRVFRTLNLSIEQEDTGGSESRSVRLDLETGRIDIRRGSGELSVLAAGMFGFKKQETENAGTYR